MILLTDENPCDECEYKVEDTYGLFCDIVCGKHSAWVIRQEAYKAQLKKVVEWGEELCSEHGKPQFKRQCGMCWQALLKEIE